MKKTIAFLLCAALALLLPVSAIPQCIVPANGTNVQTTSYSLLAGDNGKIVVMNCAAACTATLPNPPPTNVWFTMIQNIGAGTVTVSRNSLNIDTAAANITLYSGEGITISTDGTNYLTANRGRFGVRSCDIAFGDTSASALSNAQLGPQKRVCFIPRSGTVLEVNVAADAGTPNIIMGRNRAGSTLNLTSAALTTAGSGGIACSNVGGVTGIDGATTCSNTLQNTGLNAGDYIEAVSGTAGGTAKFMTVHVVYLQVN